MAEQPLPKYIISADKYYYIDLLKAICLTGISIIMWMIWWNYLPQFDTAVGILATICAIITLSVVLKQPSGST